MIPEADTSHGSLRAGIASMWTLSRAPWSTADSIERGGGEPEAVAAIGFDGDEATTVR